MNTTAAIQVQRFDLRGEPIVLAPEKWNPHMLRDPRTMRGVVLHAWDVSVGTEARLRMSLGGEGPALARRALGAPYNVCGGVGRITGVPVVVLAHPVERYTHASDAACRDFVSVGLMGRFPFTAGEDNGRPGTVITDALQAVVDAALDEAVKMLPEGDRPHLLITHRQACNGQRDHFNCPGEAAVMMALRSPAVRSGLLVPDPELVLVAGVGRPWPGHWRRHFVGRPATKPPALLAPVLVDDDDRPKPSAVTPPKAAPKA